MLSEISNKIAERKSTRLILIAGPSSSGKTTTSKRLALHLRVDDLNPIVLELDNYFLERDKSPKLPNGEYDFESLYAMDLPFLNKQLHQLFDGEEVEIPKYDFHQGKRVFTGEKLQLGESDILIMEGIHALNPELTSTISREQKFLLYIEPMSELAVSKDDNVSSYDMRLLRRMTRDNLFRGTSPIETIRRWPSVRMGEIHNIYPFKENADAYFNTFSTYEVPLLKCYIEPLLMGIPECSDGYEEVQRILGFLNKLVPLTPTDITAVPPTSIMREFIGGSSFDY
jgi:uridine kinase